MKELNEKDDSLFYCDIDESELTNSFVSELREYSTKNLKQVYILKRMLGTGKNYTYDLSDIAIVLMPEHPILLINYGNAHEEELEEFLLDFKEDLGFLSDKYNYKAVLGRARKWSDDLFSIVDLHDFDLKEFISKKIESVDYRKIDLLISLLIGSINDINRIGAEEPQTILEKVKQKIILFDGQQSRFIYQSCNQKVITIQGMAGTGKTELLLHKLKDVYSLEKDSVMAFTCFNKVLANDMETRIPNFFNFLKVEEQIDWKKRLFVFSSWGSASDPCSGLYSFICHKYGLPFSNYSSNPDFDSLCLSAVELLNKMEKFVPCFDYIFVDESQDFKESFFKLCEKVTKKTLYIAGDIFQNIYDISNINKINPDFLLNKCYRTDPKTLMFAHAVGMGLYESPHINWLDDSAWKACGYILERDDVRNNLTLSRKPLRRFEDLDATNTVRLFINNDCSYSKVVLNAIDEIKRENITVSPDDIAIVILSNYKTLCSIADEIVFLLEERFGWASTRGYISKHKQKDMVYISNENNVKGLEFPFVICVVPRQISQNILLRNSIYMALTRSFLTSYFIVDNTNEEFYEIYLNAFEKISRDGKMILREPSILELKDMKSRIQITMSSKNKLFSQILDDLFNDEYPGLNRKDRKFIEETIGRLAANLSEDEIKQRTRSFIDKVMGASVK